ncbi:MAG: pyridoxal-phosphate dependent enzyme [Caldilineaceae bacterium]|nr:pyridoxal-phosphate dependent enzyme [Caldilineaceae bacterium]
MSQPITLRRIYQARGTIAPYAVRTPLVRSDALSDMSGRDIFLKLETAQVTGAFKIRGAANRLCNLTPAAQARGVVTVSTGNHGRAVAQVGRALGIRVVVCVPELVLPHKVAAMAKLGAEIVVAGANQDEAEAHAADLAAREGLTMVSPFDDPDVIAGQGTIGLEILEDLPAVDTVVAPLSGGGLLGGIALAVKTADPDIRVVGVSMAKSPVMVESVKAGHVVQLPEEPTLADSLMGGIGLDNRHSFELIRRLVDEYVLLSEEEIATAMRFAFLTERQIVEGGGAVALGAVLHQKIATLGATVVVVLSGRNVDTDKLLTIVGAGQ